MIIIIGIIVIPGALSSERGWGPVGGWVYIINNMIE